MKDKYYIPTIEEFHIGFKFDYDNSREWVEDTIFDTTMSLRDISKSCRNKEVRVKYLNIEDIKSFGFIHSNKSLKGLNERFYLEHRKRIHPNVGHRYHDIYIQYYPDRNTIIIESKDIGSKPGLEKFFEGTIRNKSEFKILLTQLNIITSER